VAFLEGWLLSIQSEQSEKFSKGSVYCSRVAIDFRTILDIYIDFRTIATQK